MRARERRRRRSGMEDPSILAVQVVGDREAEELARADAVEAVPGDARRGVFGGSAEGLAHALKGL